MKTIKVKETKNHKAGKLNWSADNRELLFEEAIVPVAEAKLVLVRVLKREDALIGMYPNGSQLFDHKYYVDSYPQPCRWFKPILISETEDIVDGDKAIDYENSSEIFTVVEVLEDCFIDTAGKTRYTNNDPHQCYKVLALPEHFSSKLLQDIVDGKLKDGDRVLVECVYVDYSELLLKLKNTDPFNMIRLNSSGHITLHKLEEKMYTEYRVLTLLHWLNNNTYMNGGKLQRYRGFEHTPESLLEYFNTNVK